MLFCIGCILYYLNSHLLRPMPCSVNLGSSELALVLVRWPSLGKPRINPPSVSLTRLVADTQGRLRYSRVVGLLARTRNALWTVHGRFQVIVNPTCPHFTRLRRRTVPGVMSTIE